MIMRISDEGQKPALKDYIKTAAVILAFVVFSAAVIALLSGKQKDAKTTAQMTDVLSGYGFESHDFTQNIKEKLTGLTVNEVVYYVKDDMTFEYYILGDANEAISLYGNINSNLSKIERDKKINEKYVLRADGGTRANITCTSLTTDEMFCYICRIGNSVLYVKCNPNSKNDAYKIINELGYNTDR